MPSSAPSRVRAAQVFPILLLVALLAPGLASAKVEPPVVSSLQILTSPTLGGRGQVIWAGVPAIAPNSAQLVFRATAPDGKVTTASQSLALVKGRAADATFSFATPRAGTYRIESALAMRVGKNQFVKTQALNLALSAGGRATLVRLPVLTAPEFAARAPKPRFAAPAYAAATPGATPGAGFVVTGAYRFTNKLFDYTGITGTRIDPIRRAKIEVFQTDGGNTTTSLGSALTGDGGAFTFNVPPAAGAAARNLLVRLWAFGDHAKIIDDRNMVYYFDIPVVSWAGGTLNLGTTTMPIGQSGPWNIFDATLQGYQYIRQFTTAAIPQVRCRWAYGSTDGTYFSRPDNTIAILGDPSDPDEFDDAVILHEYGHFIMGNLAWDKNPGGPHSWYDHISPRLAWSEGWATFFSSAVRNYPWYVDTNFIYGGFSLDIETPNDQLQGDDNEGAIATALWDIFDSHDDGRDQLSAGFTPIWQVVVASFTYFSNCVFSDFYTGWIIQGIPHLPELQNILIEHGIPYPALFITRMSLNNGAATTPSPTVTINNTCIGTPTAWMAAETADFAGAVWQPYSTAPAFTFSAGGGNKGLYFKVKDAAGNESKPVIDTIIVGSVPVTPLVINGPSVQGQVISEFDYDLYTFRVTTAGRYTLDTQSVAAASGAMTDSVMSLYGPDDPNLLVAENDDGHGRVDHMSLIACDLQPGLYTVKVKGYETDTGAYKIWLVSGGPTPDLPVLQLNGAPLGGELNLDQNITENWYRFTITTAGAYTIQTGEGTLHDSVMNLYGPDSQTALLEMDDDGGQSYMSMISRTLVPGTYFVKITSYSSDATGPLSYTIRLLSGSRGTVAPLAIRTTVTTGTITAANPFNWYSFTIVVPGSYAIETTSGTLHDTKMFLHGPNSPEVFIGESDDSPGSPMAAATAELHPGVFYLKVQGETDSDIGTYGVRVRSTISGPALDTRGVWTAGDISSTNSYNWFHFTVPADGDYQIDTLAGTLSDTILFLYGPDDALTFLAMNDDAGTKNRMSRLVLALKKGTYYARVEGYHDPQLGPLTGSFSIRALRLPMASATALALGAAPRAGAVSFPGEIDWYSFTVTRRDTYIVEATPGALPAGYLRVYGPGSQIALLAQAGGPGRPCRLMLPNLAPGTYYIRFQGYTAADLGTYAIQARPEVQPLDLEAAPLSRTITGPRDLQWFSFVVPATGSYTIESFAGTLTNNYMRLYGPNNRGQMLAQNDNGGAGNMAKITMTLAPGTYYVMTQGYSATDVGTYSIGVRQNVITLKPGASAAWNAIGAGRDADWYSFTLTKRKKCTIDTRAGTLTNNYMRLYGPNSRTALIAQDDNSGKGSMARITRTLEPGTYYVMINAFDANATGTYSIRLTVK